MELIALTKGEHALVDDEDFERVNQFKWSVAVDRAGRKVAIRTDRTNGKITVYMHRFILNSDADRIDHADHNGLNNQKSNLRPCTAQQNGRNRLIQRHSSKFKGVSFYRLAQRWTACIQINCRISGVRKRLFLGYFHDESVAAKAYDDAALWFFGAFAKTNQQLGVL